MEYVQIQNNSALPDISRFKPFKCVVVIDQEVAPEWQAKVSDWLCESGCLYMMAWGINCNSWDDSVDSSNILQFEGKEIPDESFVATTWHAEELLSEVLWFSKHSAFHLSCDLQNTVILHISVESKRDEISQEYENA
ncbi:hypothetical protein [Teredinibacter sp. KSP-S5-2]|uniref:DUF7684 family protein n=1 Tax=Teredinibacter sp. KSP-S5-2 TaxID=3034506 RepID=UPI0029342C88|nr:hypothetical protein [Teredinibacter sp. KSP-S5-2]WNO08453.1 hypothetical protein P5V12_15895 [Teredinibacter sp. KSP-S5-2]